VVDGSEGAVVPADTSASVAESLECLWGGDFVDDVSVNVLRTTKVASVFEFWRACLAVLVAEIHRWYT
jgi:hypothetical protein